MQYVYQFSVTSVSTYISTMSSYIQIILSFHSDGVEIDDALCHGFYLLGGAAILSVGTKLTKQTMSPAPI